MVHCSTDTWPKLSQRMLWIRKGIHYSIDITTNNRNTSRTVLHTLHYGFLFSFVVHFIVPYTFTQPGTVLKPTPVTRYRRWQPSDVTAETSSQTSFKRPDRWRDELYWATVYSEMAELLGRYLFKLLFRASTSLLMLSSLANPENLLTAKQLLLHFSNWTLSSELGSGGFSVYIEGR